MVITYPAIFTQTKDEKDTYLIYIPDIKGMTEGYGLADAVHMARDYIGCALYEKEDKDFPAPSPIWEIDPGEGEFKDVGESFVSLVDIDIDAYRREMDSKPVRRNVSLPSWLNRQASEAHINVSRVLQEALIGKLQEMGMGVE